MAGGPRSSETKAGGFIFPEAEIVIVLDQVTALLGYLQGNQPQPTELAFCNMVRLDHVRTVALPGSGLDSLEPLFMLGAAVESRKKDLDDIIADQANDSEANRRKKLAAFAKMARNAAFHNNVLSFSSPSRIGQWHTDQRDYTIRVDVQKVPHDKPLVNGYDSETGGNSLKGRKFVGDYMWPLAPLLLLWDVRALLL